MPFDPGYAGNAVTEGAGIAFITPDGLCLFLKRSSRGDHAGEWCLPGGTAKDDETPLETARREAIEEIGDIPEGKLRELAHITLDGVEFVTFVQRVKDDLFAPELNYEHTDHIWAQIDDPPEPLHPGVERILPMLASARMGMDAEWKESDHPRDEAGRFGEGGGGAAAKGLPAGATIKDLGNGSYSVKHNGREIATAHISDNGDYLSAINVDPEYRRQGIATALKKHIEQHSGKTLKPSPYLTPSGKEFTESFEHKRSSEHVDEHGFTSAPGLSPEHRKIEQGFYDAIRHNPKALIGTYRKRFGNVIDPDKVKLLSRSFVGDRKLAPVVHEPSSLLSKMIFTAALKDKAARGDTSPTLFTAGGSGSGKSEAMDVAIQALGLPDDGLTFDSTLSNTKSAIKKIDEALDTAPGPVSIVYTNSPIEKAFAFNAIRKRAVQGGTLEHAHLGASKTIRELAQHYADNPRVKINILNNQGHLGDIHVGTIDDVPSYDPDVIKSSLQRVAKKLLDDGRIKQDRYEYLTGSGQGGGGGEEVRGQASGQDPGRSGQRSGRSGGSGSSGLPEGSSGRDSSVDDSGGAPRLAGDHALVEDPEMALDRATGERLAFDRASVRSYDQDGRLRIEISNISKATVNPYYGFEIPDAEELGLDPRKVYYLLRDPEELAKATASFNGIPILSDHRPTTADDIDKEMVIGTTGTDAIFKAPYLCNSLIFWDQDAIDKIERNESRELSSAYRYVADMTPGVYEGRRYDGVMREILGNHVTLVRDGRAGSDVIVGDSQPRKEVEMTQQVLSRRAMLAKGALLAVLPPLLAQDARPTLSKDLNKILIGVASDNWKMVKPKILEGIKKLKLAKDASIENLTALLNGLDGEGAETEPQDASMGMGDEPPPGAPPAAKPAAPAAPAAGGPGYAGDPIAEIMEALKGVLPPDKLAWLGEKLKSLRPNPEHAEIKPAGQGAEPEAKPAMDEPPGGEGQPKPPVSSSTKDPLKDKDGAMSQAVSKTAMDAAIAKAQTDTRRETMAQMRAVADAEAFVVPWVGKLTLACDTAEGVFKAALEVMEIDLTDVHPSAYKHILAAQPKPSDKPAPSERRMAQDAATSAGALAAKLAPDVMNLRVM
jgi:uncharacterized protein